MKRYLLYFLLFFVAWLGFEAAFTLGVDPYRLTGSRFFGLSAEKTRIHEGGWRILKSLDLRRKPYDIIIIGASRSEIGLNPHGRIGEDSVYNASLMSAKQVEQKIVFDYILRHQTPEKIVINLGFVNFREGKKKPAPSDFGKSAFNGRPVPLILLERTFSYNALADSIQTIVDNLQGKKTTGLPDGSIDGEAFYHGLAGSKKFVIDTLTWQYLSHIGGYRRYRYDESAVEITRSMIRAAKARGIEPVVYVAPVHAIQLETVRLTGLQPSYERWKRDLSRVSHEEGVPIIDFSSYNDFTTGEVFGPNPWFWEPSHSKAAFGDLILNQIVLGKEGPGVALAPDMIDDYLRRQNREHERYVNTHTDDMETLKRVVKGAIRIYGPFENEN